MASPDTTPKPFQFGLRSIFLVTAVVGVALALLKLHVLFAIPIVHALAGGLLIVLTKRKAAGSYMAGLVLGGVLFGLASLGPSRLSTTEIAILFVSVVTLAGWLIGAIGAMFQVGIYPGLGWSFLMWGGIWLWVLASFILPMTGR